MERAAGGSNLWMFLDTLASAQHLKGRSAEALNSQREALRLLPPKGEQFRGEMEERIRLYEKASTAASLNTPRE